MKSVVTKLTKIISEIKAVKKDGKNDFSNYDYISYEQLNAIVRPLLSKHNLIIVPNITEITEHYSVNSKDKEVVRTILKGTVKAICGETGEILEFGMVGADQDTGGKSASQAVTEFDKRALFKMFKVSSKADIDPDSKTVETTQKKPEPKPEPKPDTAKLIEALLKIAGVKGYSKEDIEKKIKMNLENASIELIQKAVDHYAKAETKQKRLLNGLAKSSGKTIIEINKKSQELYKKDFENLDVSEMEKVKGALNEV